MQQQQTERKRASFVRSQIVFGVLFVCFLAFCWNLRHVIGMVYLSALFAVVLTPIVRGISSIRIRTWHPGKALSIVILLVLIFGGLTLFFWFAFPPVVTDFRSFLGEIPKRLSTLGERLNALPIARKIGVDNLAAKVENEVGKLGALLITSLPTLAGHMLDVVTVIVLTVYFILEGAEVFQFFLSMVPQISRNRLSNTLLEAENRVSRWLIGQLMLMLIVCIYSLIVFRVLNVRYFLLLGILMGLTNIIPVAGNMVTIGLVAIVAAMDSWGKMALVIVFYLIYTQVENAYLTPRIMKSSVDLMGTTVLVGLLCGMALAGIPGALAAVPTAAVVVVFAREYLVQHEDDPNRTPLIE